MESAAGRHFSALIGAFIGVGKSVAALRQAEGAYWQPLVLEYAVTGISNSEEAAAIVTIAFRHRCPA